MKGINVFAYMRSFSPKQIGAVRQFLRTFKCCDELLLEIEKVIEDRVKASIELSAKAAVTRKAAIRKVHEPKPLKVIPGEICPKCDSPMAGTWLDHCEVERSRRVYYRECTVCTFYCETIQRGEGLFQVICSKEV